MLGFLPGFAFMGDTPPELHLPRRSEPRLRVPAGSVAIAMQLTGVYPWDSPGGWHILGQCPIPLFDASADPPALLKAGDTVRFRGINDPEFDAIRGQVREQTFCRTSLRRAAADS
jgi:KipI family sensor histidine kinase inhibitor